MWGGGGGGGEGAHNYYTMRIRIQMKSQEGANSPPTAPSTIVSRELACRSSGGAQD